MGPWLREDYRRLAFALGALAIGDCAPRVLVVAPQDLIPQWFAEIGKFFGAEFAAEWFVVSGVEDAIQLARLSRKVPKDLSVVCHNLV